MSMYWVFFLLGLGVIAVFALAAIGALGQLEPEKSLESESEYLTGQRIPSELFGYQKKRVKKIISELESEIVNLKAEKK